MGRLEVSQDGFGLLRSQGSATIFRAHSDPSVEPITLWGYRKLGGFAYRPQGMGWQEDQMDSFELNKIMGAVLGTLLFVMGAGFVAEAIYQPIEGRGPGYALPEPEAVAGGEAVEAAPEVPIGVLLASASAERGQASVRKCQSCHNFGEGEPSKQGPHLYGVVGRPEGAIEDFAYSEGIMAHNAAGDIWSYDNINLFLTKPSAYVPGTKMNFAGIRTAEERAESWPICRRCRPIQCRSRLPTLSLRPLSKVPIQQLRQRRPPARHSLMRPLRPTRLRQLPKM